jgi:hypothetical protein
MVLLDSTAPASAPGPPPKTGSYDLLGRISALLPAMAHLGVARLYAQFSYDTLPPRSRDEARARSATSSDVESSINEFRAGAMAAQQAASLVDFAGKPLIVITAGREHDAKWLSAQNDLATLSTNSRHRVVADARMPHFFWIRLMPPPPARHSRRRRVRADLQPTQVTDGPHETYSPSPHTGDNFRFAWRTRPRAVLRRLSGRWQCPLPTEGSEHDCRPAGVARGRPRACRSSARRPRPARQGPALCKGPLADN